MTLVTQTDSLDGRHTIVTFRIEKAALARVLPPGESLDVPGWPPSRPADAALTLERALRSMETEADEAGRVGEIQTCSLTGLPCISGCDRKECAGAHIPINEWPA